MQAVILSEIVEVSPQAISQYEKDRSSPSPQVLTALAAALNVPETFFTFPDRPISDRRVFYRSMSAATKGARARAEHRARWLNDLVEYVSDFVELPKPNLPDFSLSAEPLSLTPQEIEEIAMDTRQHWRMRDSPIGNMVTLLENHGVIVARDRLGAATLDSLSESPLRDNSRAYMIIGTDKGTPARWRFDAAHELGHLILHRALDPRRLLNKTEHKMIENQAHRFAGAFLLPSAPFAEDFYSASLDALTSMKPKWQTSIAMMIMRARQTGLISDETERRLWINYSRRGWRRHEPYDDTMTTELPRVLSRSFDLIFAEAVQAPEDVITATGLPPRDIESLSGMPDRYLQSNLAPVTLKASPTLPFNVTPLRRSPIRGNGR